jgi:hypothetical protein
MQRYVIEQSTDLNPQAIWAFKRNVTLSASAQTALEISFTGEGRFFRARLLP